MVASEQLLLDITPSSSFSKEDYIVSSSNQEAFQYVNVWPQWITYMLNLYGPAGAGKTHLAHIWARQAQALYFYSVEEFFSYRYKKTFDCSKFKAAIIDNFVLTLDKEEQFFHLYNAIMEKKMFLLMLSQKPISEEKYELMDLSSRLKSVIAFEIKQPDDLLLKQLFMRYFSKGQVEVKAEVISFLTLRAERSFSYVHKVCYLLNKKALQEHRPITVPLAKEVLDMFFSS